MNTILESKQEIKKIWGIGNISKTKYRLFLYVVKTEIDDKLLLLNLVTGQLIVLNKEEAKYLNSLPCDYESWMDELIKAHYLVQFDNVDKNTVNSLRLIGKTIYNAAKHPIDNYVILPTTNCNAHCFYCFEHNKNDFVYENMSEETINKTVNFIVKNHDDKKVHINWFGGEPLLCVKQISKISKGLKDKNVDFSSEIVTNGFLFNDLIINIAKNDWNLTKAQITLDGTENNYNKIKNYADHNCSPYQKVLRNIELLASNGISVLILLNLGLHNSDDVISLADELVARFKSFDNVTIDFHKLYESCGDITKYTDKEYDYLLKKEDELYSYIYKFNKYSDDDYEIPSLKFVNCLSDREDGVVINPSGKITKCMHYLSDHIVGDLDNGIINNNEKEFYKKQRVFPTCEKCNLYASCYNLQACEKFVNCRPIDIENKQKLFEKISIYHYLKYKSKIK